VRMAARAVRKRPFFDITSSYPKLVWGRDEARRRLCYDQQHGWMVTVVVTLPDILPCVLRAAMGPLGKGCSAPAFWRNMNRYWISRRLCCSISCSVLSSICGAEEENVRSYLR
jgi:hypothetical protein